MFTYQKTNRYFAQIARGLEQYGAEELTELGCGDVKPVFMGIYFNADSSALYRANYMSRMCTKILAPLLTFDCHSTKYLYKTAGKIKWDHLLSPENTFAVNASVTCSKIKHSQYAALCLKDAVVDYFRDHSGARPGIDKETHDIAFHLRIEHNRAIISLDTSGGSLHRRGYRQVSVEAPMQETLAAALIHLSRWDGDAPLIDPMCGSGTIITEALMRFCRIPAAYLRKKFGFEMMPEFDGKLWNEIKAEANSRIRPLPKGLLTGSDASPDAVAAARHNCNLLPNGEEINIKTKRYQDVIFPDKGVIITNPPYGIRLKQEEGAGRFMRELGAFLKKQRQCTAAYLYAGRPELIKQTGLPSVWQKKLMNGGLEGILAKFSLY